MLPTLESWGTFFKNVYKLLIDKEKGPRLYLFLFAVDPKGYLPLLDFSTPMADAEKPVVTAEEATETEESPAKAEISIDDFDTVDLTVCEIVKCEEIKKSRSCYKLTLNDGKGERIIVSSIKSYYTPEQLEGKKIIVITNLKPAKLMGVQSNGMLLAASYGDNCKVLFADDSVPAGTKIH
jgi:lysyl-tRNA synthetase class 1